MKVLSWICGGLMGLAVTAFADGYACSSACRPNATKKSMRRGQVYHALAERKGAPGILTAEASDRVIGYAPLIQFLVKTNGGRVPGGSITGWGPEAA